MKHDHIATGKRRPVNVSLDSGIVDTARSLGINLSGVVETGLRDAIKTEQERRWRIENSEWIEGHNRSIEANGIPLADLPVL